MNKPILAITVPTYNRGQLLGLLLDSIARDFPVWPDDLELVVLDNASTDDTRQQVAYRIARGVPIRLSSNAENIGMDGNLAACFGAVQAKYLWQVGDDEILHQGACRYVLDFCRKREFGLLHIENIGFRNGEQDAQMARAIPAEVEVTPLDSRSMFRRANVYLTFISANVINREAILAAEPAFDSRSEAGTFLPQLAWIYGVLKHTQLHFHVRTPLFGALGGNSSGYRLIEVFGTNLLAITERQLSGSIPRARAVMANAVLSRLIPGELRAHATLQDRNRFEQEDLRRVIDQAFGCSIYSSVCVKPMLSSSRLKRRTSWFATRLINRVNRQLNYPLL